VVLLQVDNMENEQQSKSKLLLLLVARFFIILFLIFLITVVHRVSNAFKNVSIPSNSITPILTH
jgi:hypothetical protein